MIKTIVAIGNTDWEPAFISALRHPASGITIQRRCVDGVDVRSAIHSLSVDLILLSDHTPRVDVDLVAQAQAESVRVVALSNTPEPWSAIGVRDVIPIDVAEPAKAMPALMVLLRTEELPSVPDKARTGKISAFVGFGGGAGRTTVARETAWQLAASGLNTVLVDADTFNASMIQEMGLDPATRGLLELCRAHETRSLDTLTSSSLLAQVAPNLAFVGGLARSSRWTDLRVPALRGVWGFLQTEFDHILIDVGPVIEHEGSLAHEIAMPRRYSAAHTALESAQTVVFCSRADSIGLSRLVKGYLEFSDQFATKEIHVVTTGVNSRSQLKQVREVIRHHLGINSVTAIPFDHFIAQRVTERHSFMAYVEPHSEVVSRFKECAQLLSQTHSTEELVPASKQRLRSIKNAA